MKAAMVVTWTGTRTGREALAASYARSVDEFWTQQAASGKCSEPKWFWATNGPSYWIVEGEYEDLLALSSAPEAQRLLVEGPLLAENFGMELCLEGRETMLQPMENLLSELHLV